MVVFDVDHTFYILGKAGIPARWFAVSWFLLGLPCPHWSIAHRSACRIRTRCPVVCIYFVKFISQVAESEKGIIMKPTRSNRALKDYTGKISTTIENTIVNAGNAGWYGNAYKAGAIPKSQIPNAGNAGWYSNTNKAGAISKSEIPNAGNAGWYSNTNKVGTIPKNGISNAGNTAWYSNANKVGTTKKSTSLNAGNAAWYSNTGKAGAIPKSGSPNAGNTVWYGYASKKGVPFP